MLPFIPALLLMLLHGSPAVSHGHSPATQRAVISALSRECCVPCTEFQAQVLGAVRMLLAASAAPVIAPPPAAPKASVPVFVTEPLPAAPITGGDLARDGPAL